MSVRASLIAALVALTSLASVPAAAAASAASAAAASADSGASAVQPAAVAAVRAADPVTPEVASVPVGPEPDGTAVRLDISVWPQASGKHPVVLLAHGFGGSKDSVTEQAIALHERGYVVVAWSARGHGSVRRQDPPQRPGLRDRRRPNAARPRSQAQRCRARRPRRPARRRHGRRPTAEPSASCSPERTAASTASSRPSRGTTSPTRSSPRRRSPTAPTTAAGRAPIATPGPFKQVWATNFFLSANQGAGGAAANAGTPASSCGRFDPTICRLFVQASESGTASPELLALLHAHSPKPTMAQVTAPTLLVQGVADSLFGLDQADANAQALAASGTPYAVRWSDGGHDGPSSHEAEETEASYQWLDHYVRDKAPHGGPLPTAAFTYGIPATRSGQPSTLATLPAYPGLSGARLVTRDLPLVTTGGALVHPPGGQPASLIAVPGLAALGISLSTYQIAALPGQSTALDSQPIAEATTVVGSPTMRFTVTSDRREVTLFASIWRVTGGSVTLTNPLVAPVRLEVTPGRPTPVTISLPGATYELPAGTRWRVLLTSTESTYCELAPAEPHPHHRRVGSDTADRGRRQRRGSRRRGHRHRGDPRDVAAGAAAPPRARWVAGASAASSAPARTP